MSKIYTIRIEDASFEDFDVEADGRDEAEEIAISLSQLDEPYVVSVEEI